MKIIDLDEKNKYLYFICLEDWSEEMKESGNHKQKWFEKMKDKGLRVKLSLDDNETVSGMIQYVPIEHSTVEGKDLYFINCIWVHGHKQGRGDFRKRGIGKALLQAAEDDVKTSGAKGLAAWGLRLPVWMKASWFRRHGYATVDKMGMQALVWKRFTPDAVPPK
jgi:GNAT superfamily N-acetyltransferase